MRPPLYSRQLRQDLDEWIARGWVPQTSRDLILGQVGALGPSRTLPSILAIMGVVLLGAGAMSFVAANWAMMGKLVRLILLLGSMAAAYGFAISLMARGQAALAQAAILLGVALFGVSIMLVAQTYHINAGFSDGLLMWGAGALIAAVLVPSRPAMTAAILIGAAWTIAAVEETGYETPHFAFLVYLAVPLVLAHVWNSMGEMHLVILSLVVWAVLNAVSISDTYDWSAAEVISAFSLFTFAMWTIGRVTSHTRYPFSQALARYGLILTGFGLVVLHTLGDEASSGTMVTAGWIYAIAILGGIAVAAVTAARIRDALTPPELAIALAIIAGIIAFPVLVLSMGDGPLELPVIVLIGLFIVWVIAHGVRLEDRVLTNSAFVGFGAWVLYVYVDVFGTLLDQATFFLIGGVILVVTSIALEAVRRTVGRDHAIAG